MTLQDYISALRNKQVAVVGIGVSNRPLIQRLASSGIQVTACDKCSREDLGNYADRLEDMGVRLRLGEDYLKKLSADVIFRSPGIRPDIPAFEAARAKGAVITSEMEAFFQVCPCTIIAVTGSDGKTTTTTIIAGLLEEEGYTVHVGGNIGHPLLAEADEMNRTDIAVLELSSFQLMTLKQSPEVAVVTNLAPNHLDIHLDMDEYVSAKKNIFLHQKPEHKTILNYDNELTRHLGPQCPGQVVFFSRQNPLESGFILENGTICLREDGKSHPILRGEDILIPGVHNVENYMAAIAAVDGLVSDDTIVHYAKHFAGVEHRIELVRELHGVRYYNDSIASSPSRTIAGLRSFSKKVILIAGGYDKHLDYDIMGPDLLAHVKAMLLTGDTSVKIRLAAEGMPGYNPLLLPILEVEDLSLAVSSAQAMARPGDVVLMSPASASFDRYKNFMERGNTFKALVAALE